MFRKYSPAESISSQTLIKTSVQRGIRQSILDQYPALEPHIEDLMPKKLPLHLVKCQNHLNLVVVNQEILFFNERDGPYMPTLRLLHKYPDILPHMRVDRGAIKFVMSGANVMCPGLTHPNASMATVPESAIVAVMAEGKQHAMAIGITTMSTEKIRKVNKGIAIEAIHFLNDGLWKNPKVE
eukprot:TRINITY_DN4429_c0_g1_i1.p1 TRINITY_DN4429_c0_g1~~TRINITY_DN4429_c0_g1_i1.p1  ORF type:complete len:182 (-),score=42.83 TRINITY_DN4429_c0_g1_i1:121-666(-)